MNLEGINSLKDLYKRLKPALYSKIKELKIKKIDYVFEEDVWNYLSENVWKGKKDLSISEMVNDIFVLKDEVIISYVLDILKKEEREILEKESDIL